MRVRGHFALLGPVVLLSAALIAAADEPAPLLKVVAPTGTNVRVRFLVTPGYPKPMFFTAQVPKAKKKSELLDVKVAYDSIPNPSYISVKRLENWGYEVPKGAKEFLLPELFISAVQVAPKATKGSDVVVRLANIKLTLVPETAGQNDTIHECDLCLSALALFGGNERTMEPRLSFADKFLEMTVPPAMIAKRLGTDGTAPEVSVSADTKLAPSFGPLVLRSGLPMFAYAAIDGQDSYKLPDGKTVVPVNVMVSSISNMPDGVMVTLGLARGVKLDFNANAAGQAAVGVEAKSEFIPGKIKELRLGVHTGPGMKAQKDLVIKDVPVFVDKNVSEGYMMIGQKFIDTYFVDGVYLHAGDGWKLHGRVNPELLFDIKTRKKP
jgi:hypothetical protein